LFEIERLAACFVALQLVVGFEASVLEVFVLLAAKERTWRSGKVVILWPANGSSRE